ncbi:MAG: leucine-rich repeat protein [Bacteroidaceae bacterium]|nr:leucine-rich repeat protein [Bacteroidaceae bacterium]
MSSGVESIGDYAFWMADNIKDVYITDLSAWCRIHFSMATSNPLNGSANLHLNGKQLTNLVIPDDVTEIKQYAFSNCQSINTIDFGNVTSIGNYAFYCCYNLAGELVIPNSVKTIDYGAFSKKDWRNNGLTSIVFGDGITELKNGTFDGCGNAGKITFGKNIETIEENTFARWSYSSLTFNSDTVKNWFREQENVTEVHFGSNVKAITEGAFAHCNIDSVHIPAGITSIGDYAFSWNRNLRKATVAPGNNVYNAAEEHNVIMETATNKVMFATRGATIPNYATAIGNGAFNGLLGVNELIIPANIESIGEWAFDGCEELKTVINYSGLLLTKGSTDYGYVAYYADEVTNITGIIDDYVFLTIDTVNNLIDYIGEADELVLPNDFNGENYVVAAGAFKNKKVITSIALSDGVTEIGDSAFAGCEALEELEISATVGKIGKGITNGCNALATISVDEGNSTFDNREECNAVISNIEYVASGDTTWVATTSPEAGNTYILECPVFNSVQGVRKALYNKDGSTVAWKTLDETDDSFLWKVESTATGNVLKSVKDGRYLIGKESNETNWTLESSSTGCEFSIIPLDGNEVSVSITNRHLHAADHQGGSANEGRIVSWETNSAGTASAWIFVEQKMDDVSQPANTLILGCKNSNIPESVVAIGEGAFSGVQELQSITIPASVTAIGKEAFKACTGLETIYSKGTTPATVYGSTFNNYSATLYVPTGAKATYQAADYWKNFANIAEKDFDKGDITGDGSVDVSDLTTLVSMILDSSNATDVADINGDGSVDVSDLTTLVSIILGTAPAKAEE